MYISDKKIKTVGEKIGIDWDQIDFNQFKKGLNLELEEHGDLHPQTDVIHHSLIKAGKIALAHLKELPDYYSKLNKMEMSESIEKAPITKKTISPNILKKLAIKYNVDLSNYNSDELENGIIKELELMQTFTIQSLTSEKLEKAFEKAFQNINKNPTHYSNNMPLVSKSAFQENNIIYKRKTNNINYITKNFNSLKESLKLSNVYKNQLLTEKKFIDLKLWKNLSPAKQILFLTQKGELIGKGSSRAVYLIDGKKVLKLAMDEKGLAQNKTELELFNNPSTTGLITKIYEASPDNRWLVSELAKPFKNTDEFANLTGIPFDMIGTELQRILKGKSRKKFKSGEHINTDQINNPLIGKLVDLVQYQELMWGDLEELSSWGKTADGRLVLLDYGFTQDVADKHYKKKIQHNNSKTTIPTTNDEKITKDDENLVTNTKKFFKAK